MIELINSVKYYKGVKVPAHFVEVNTNLREDPLFIEHCKDFERCIEDWDDIMRKVIKIARLQHGYNLEQRGGIEETTFELWLYRNKRYKEFYIKWQNGSRRKDLEPRVMRRKLLRTFRVANIIATRVIDKSFSQYISKFHNEDLLDINFSNVDSISYPPKKDSPLIINNRVIKFYL